jgi:predicted O-methyltransferase YrrM
LAWQGQRAIGEYYRPILSSLHLAGATIETAIDPVLAALDIPLAGQEDLPVLANRADTFPALYDSDDLTRMAIWQVVRSLQPEIVVETGVANGLSTRTILAALRANGHGKLCSFDVDPRAASSVPEEARARWEFTLLDAGSAMPQLAAAVRPLSGGVGMWFHDSDHNYGWQRYEYDLAASVLAPGGVLISDDADGTEAFADFCLSEPTWLRRSLFDTRKVCGFARKPINSQAG